MRVNRVSTWLNGISLCVLFLVSAAPAVLAQTPDAPDPSGQTTAISGLGSALRQSTDVKAVSAGNGIWRVRAAGATQATVRESDSLWNGLAIGAGVGVASGLFLCRLTEPWENCRDDVGPMLRIGAIGAGIGIAIDALIRERRTTGDAGRGSMGLNAAPLIARRTRGLQVAVRF